MRPAKKPSSCTGCPALNWGVGFVPPEVPVRQIDQILVGQGPGETEAKFSRPFHPEAPAGRTMTRWLNEAGLQRTRTLLTNVVWCWMPKAKPKGMPVGNREPTAPEISFCRSAHLDPFLKEYSEEIPRILVGAPAARSFLGVEAISKYNGTFVWRD